MDKCFQCFPLNSIYYKGRVSTEEWGGEENMPLCFLQISSKLWELSYGNLKYISRF